VGLAQARPNYYSKIWGCFSTPKHLLVYSLVDTILLVICEMLGTRGRGREEGRRWGKGDPEGGGKEVGEGKDKEVGEGRGRRWGGEEGWEEVGRGRGRGGGGRRRGGEEVGEG